MKRKNFLRDCTLAIAACLLPKILQPSFFEVEEGGKCAFDVNRINERLAELRKYPLTYGECEIPSWAYHYKEIRTKI